MNYQAELQELQEIENQLTKENMAKEIEKLVNRKTYLEEFIEDCRCNDNLFSE